MEVVDEYIKSLEQYTNERKKKKELYQSKSIEYIRNNYNKFINDVGYSLGRLNNTKEALDKLNELTQKGFTFENEARKIDKEIINILNSSRIGTLQGINRQIIKDNEIVPKPDDLVAQAVLEQPYDERVDIIRNQNKNIGGRNRKKTFKKRRLTNKKRRTIKKI
jgi:hypothetical protein